MALIDFNRFNEKTKDEQGKVIALDGLHYTCKTKKLDEVMHKLMDHDFVHWVSDGDWSMHELLLACLEAAGASASTPAVVYISSYAFSELPARIIADLKRNGTIGKLYCLIDSRIDVRSAGALQLLKATADECKLVSTHAKVSVVSTVHGQITIVGSANYTTNERFEAGYVSDLVELAEFNKKWIVDALKDVDK